MPSKKGFWMADPNPESKNQKPSGGADPPLSGAGDASDAAAILEAAVHALAHTLDARFREMGALVQASKSVSPALLLDEVLDQLYDAFRRIIPYERVSFGLVEDGGRSVRIRWERDETGT